MFDWLDNTSIIFNTLRQDGNGSSLVIQTTLTIIAAFLGAAATYLFGLVANRKRQRIRLNSLAISTMFKISQAASAQRNLKNTFFASLPEGAAPNTYWYYVLPCPEIPEEIWKLSEEEFEFLLGEDGDSDLAYTTVQLLSFSQMNLRALNEYSRQRKSLAKALDPHIVNIDEQERSIERVYDRNQHPGLYREELETADFCVQVHDSLDHAIRDAITVMELANTRIPTLTKNPKFKKQLDVNSLRAP